MLTANREGRQACDFLSSGSWPTSPTWRLPQRPSRVASGGTLELFSPFHFCQSFTQCSLRSPVAVRSDWLRPGSRSQASDSSFAWPSADGAVVVAMNEVSRTLVQRINNPNPTGAYAYGLAANAVATLAFGLMGSLVGLMAFRASGHEGRSDRT